MTSSGLPDPSRAAVGAASAQALNHDVGAVVQLLQRPAYLKSADPMPMLRPPDLIDEGEDGTVVEVRTPELRAVRFRRGTFLLGVSQLRSGASG